jgi:hypothetical protein
LTNIDLLAASQASQWKVLHHLRRFYVNLPTQESSSDSCDWIAPLNDSDENDDYCDDKQDVDKPAQRVGTDHSEQPKNQKQNRNGP